MLSWESRFALQFQVHLRLGKENFQEKENVLFISTGIHHLLPTGNLLKKEKENSYIRTNMLHLSGLMLVSRTFWVVGGLLTLKLQA